MVTAGVYLIARMHAVPAGAAGDDGGRRDRRGDAALAGSQRLAQRDIKRVLAYSTISQIGYMFLALGVGAWSAAIFHFMTHAFFKALLFLGAGAVILALAPRAGHVPMGGLRRRCRCLLDVPDRRAALAALPLVTPASTART
jgi:NADH-quinone oxidoreductase subunit L